MTKLTYDRVEILGNNSVNGARLRVSAVDLRTIEQALIDAGGSGGGGGTYGADFFTLDATDISNEYVTLSGTPTDVGSVVVFVVGGTVQYPTVDYTVSGDQVSWSGLGLSSSVAIGKRIVVMYPTAAPGGSVTAGDDRVVENITVDATILANKYYDLANIPDDPNDVVISVVGGTTQFPGATEDYIVTTDGSNVRRIDWNGLGMDSEILLGTKLVIEYSIPPTATLAITADDVDIDTVPLVSNLSGLGPGATMQDALEEIDGLTLGGGSGGEARKVEYFTGDGAGTVGTNQYFDLANTPEDPDAVSVYIVGGTVQELNVDYEVITDGSSIRRISWAALASPNMGDAISSGTRIQVVYTVGSVSTNDAAALSVDSSGFTGNLSGISPSNAQVAFATIDGLSIGGGGNGTTVADIAALTAIDDTAQSDGDQVVVENFGLYILDTSSTAKADDEVIVNTNSGTGRWLLESPNGNGIWSYLEPDLPEYLPEVLSDLDFPSIAAGSIEVLTVTSEGASSGDIVHIGPPGGIDAGLMWSAYVSADDTISLRLFNTTGSPIDPSLASWSFVVQKPNRMKSLSLRAVAIFKMLLGGSYASGAALETDLTTGGGYGDLAILFANTRSRKALLNSVVAKPIIQASATANAEMETYEGIGY